MMQKKTNDTTFLKTLAFSEDEKKLLAKAREITHVDRPAFYHDAIMSMSLRIIKDYEDGQKKVAND